MSFGVALSLLAAMLWGLSYCLEERVLRSLNPVQILFLHYLFGALITGCMISFKETTQKILTFSGHDLLMLFSALVVAFFGSLFITLSISKVGAVTAAVIEVSYPLWTSIFCVILFKEKLTLNQMIGCFLVLLGTSITSRSS